MNEENISNGNKLKLIRATLELTQLEMADKLKVKQSYYSNIESGKKRVTSNILNHLINDLDVSPNWFFYREGEMFSKFNSSNTGVLSITNSNITHPEKSSQNHPGSISIGNILKVEESAPHISLGSNSYTGGKDLETDYQMDSIVSHLNFVNKLIDANGLKENHNVVFEMLSMSSLIEGYLSHYDISSKTFDVYDKYYQKNATIEDVYNVFRIEMDLEKELSSIIQPYVGTIRELLDKIQKFNKKHDRLYCLDDE